MADSSHSTLFAGLEMGDIKVKNSRGSSAGAGSGDCHHYLQGRRAEMFRLKRLEEEAEVAKKDKEWQEKMEARKAALEAEKAKRAEKRAKKKQKRKSPPEDMKEPKKPKLEEDSSDEIHQVESPTTEETLPKDESLHKVKEFVGITLNEI